MMSEFYSSYPHTNVSLFLLWTKKSWGFLKMNCSTLEDPQLQIKTPGHSGWDFALHAFCFASEDVLAERTELMQFYDKNEDTEMGDFSEEIFNIY